MSDPATPTSTSHDYAAEIEQHAQLEHPELAWDDQSTVFTSSRFTEERAR